MPCVPAFSIAILVNRSGRVNLAFAVAFIELYFHQVAGIYYMGWGVGFQFWLIYLAGLGFFNPTWGRNVQILQIILFAATITGMYLHSRVGVYSLSPQLTDLIFLLNFIMAIGALVLLINSYSKAAHNAEKNLQKANEETRHLLLNILPEPVADRLTGGQSNIADSIDEASIVFCDLAGFTEMSSDRSAEEVVAILNGVFYGFDTITEELGLEKINSR